MSRSLSIDLETYSSVDLAGSGVYAYCGAPDFQILLVAYAYDDEPVQVIDMLSDNTEAWAALERDLLDPQITKYAFNAAFERACLARHIGQPMPPEQWECTQVKALRLGLPSSLAQVGKVMGLAQEDQKMTSGKLLIRYFCIPCVPTARNGGRTRNLPHHDPDKWALFIKYCAQDVEVERRLRLMLKDVATPFERKLWHLDQKINDTGVKVDKVLVENAITLDNQYRARLEEEAVHLTGLENPNSVSALKRWLEMSTGVAVDSLNKATVPDLIKEADSETVKRVLTIRQAMAKTSVSKYQAMDRARNHDDRVRGIHQYYGANRSGRWAGRLVQPQNLPQNKIADLDLARELVRSGEFDLLEMTFGSPAFVLSQLVRTAIVPEDGHRFIVADFSAIEARVIAWLAGERWRLDVFKGHGKIYEASASAMFNVPLESIGKGNPLRQKGKIAELALGYQGGKGALLTMGALKMGLVEEELPGLVNAWRKANPAIVRLWNDVESAAMETVCNKAPSTIRQGIQLYMSGTAMHIRMPSKRVLVYQNARIEAGKIVYDGMNQEKKIWGTVGTYGGKLVENIVQAIARDCLAEAMLALAGYGYRIVMHVHDEVVMEVPIGRRSVEEACGIMGFPIPWAPDLPLRADGYECEFYRKD